MKSIDQQTATVVEAAVQVLKSHAEHLAAVADGDGDSETLKLFRADVADILNTLDGGAE